MIFINNHRIIYLLLVESVEPSTIRIINQPVEKGHSANRLELSHQHLPSEVITSGYFQSFGVISQCVVKAHSSEVDHSWRCHCGCPGWRFLAHKQLAAAHRQHATAPPVQSGGGSLNAACTFHSSVGSAHMDVWWLRHPGISKFSTLFFTTYEWVLVKRLQHWQRKQSGYCIPAACSSLCLEHSETLFCSIHLSQVSETAWTHRVRFFSSRHAPFMKLQQKEAAKPCSSHVVWESSQVRHLSIASKMHEIKPPLFENADMQNQWFPSFPCWKSFLVRGWEFCQGIRHHFA